MPEKLTKSQVQDVIDFASGLAYGEMYNVWSPWLSNAILQNLNNDAREATSKAVRQALSDYRNNAENIQSYMEYLNCFDMIFAKTIKNYANSLAFDLQCVCINADESDYDTKVKINKREFLNCIDRATLLIREGDTIQRYIRTINGELMIFC